MKKLEVTKMVGFFSESSEDRSLDQPIDPDTVHYLTAYLEDHYSKWNIFLPKQFREFMHGSNGSRKPQDPFQLFILRYVLNFKEIKNKFQKLIELYHAKELLSNLSNFDINWFENKTAILYFFSGVGRRVDVRFPCLVANNNELDQIIIDSKLSPDSCFKYLSYFSRKEEIKWLQKNCQKIKIIDLLSKPRVVVHETLKEFTND